MSWFKRIFGASNDVTSTDHMKQLNERVTAIKAAGSVDGEHYVESVDKIKQLKREEKYGEAIDLLLKCINATEAESSKANSIPLHSEEFSWLSEGRTNNGWGVAPWYYEQLAIIYRKDKQYAKEVEILERYEKQRKAPGIGPQKLAERLAKARTLLNKSRA